jgi:sulfatase modifying factor 1
VSLLKKRGWRKALPFAFSLASVTIGCVVKPPSAPPVPACPAEMARVGAYCIDAYEAHVVELDAEGHEKPHSPYAVVDGMTVRAKTSRGVVPQGYISQVQAGEACAHAGKRLCTGAEFFTACSGANPANDYPYGGKVHKPGVCNEGKGSSMPRFFGPNAAKWTFADFNDPRLNAWDGGLATTGSHEGCRSQFGIYDCVGNLHEWVDEPLENGRGHFHGGFYGDAEINGHGCRYVTRAHGPKYHDYSTGFRCCADPK